MWSAPRLTRRSEAGMTLIEVMTVVFIIGLASSLVVLTLPRRATPAERFAEAFTADVQRANDRAVLTGRVQGIDLVEEGYQLVEWSSGDWRPVGRVSVLEGPRASFQLADAGRAVEGPTGPALIFDPTGVNAAASLDLRSGDERIQIQVSVDGEVVLDPL